MQIDSLKYFHDVATLKSISKVAQESHISQPALSQQLLKLEKKLGVTLLNRSNKGVDLTKEGEILLKYSEEILQTYNHLIEELESLEKENNIINLSAESVPASFLVGSAMTYILKTLKGYELSLFTKDNEDGKIKLLHNKVQITVGNEQINDENLISTYVGSDEIVAVVGVNTIASDMTKMYQAIFESDIISSIDIKDSNSKVLFKSNSLYNIKQILHNNSCYAYLPRICIQDEIDKGILKIISDEKIEYPFYVTYKKDIKRNIKSKINVISTKLQYILKEK